MRDQAGYRGEVMVRNGLANVCVQTGRLDEAAHHYARALELIREEDDTARAGVVLRNLALVQIGRGELDLAEQGLRDAAAASRMTGRTRSRSIAEANLGRVLMLQGREALGRAAGDPLLVRHAEALAAMLDGE